MADKKLNLKVRTQGTKKAKKDLKGVESGMTRMGKAAAKAGAAFFAAKGLITGFKKIIELAAAQELAEKKLEAALGKTSQALLNQASALQQVSMFGDEAIIEAQALIAAFVDDEEAIKKATQATLDLAAAKGMDLTAAADLVSKTLGSSTNAMSRYGIEVIGAVGSTERLDSLTGNIADKFGGQAKAQTETMAGAMRQMSMAIGDTGEKMGDLLIPSVSEFSLKIKDAAVGLGTFFQKLSETTLETATRQLREMGAAAEDIALLQNLIDIEGQTDALLNTNDKLKEKFERINILSNDQLKALGLQVDMVDIMQRTYGEVFNTTVRNVKMIDASLVTEEKIKGEIEKIKVENAELLKINKEISDLDKLKINSNANEIAFMTKILTMVMARNRAEENLVSLKKFTQAEAEVAAAKTAKATEAAAEQTKFVKQVSGDYLAVQEKLADKAAEEKRAREKMAKFASQTAISLGTSALMGDNIGESLKRAVIQLMIMVVQAKLYDHFMTSATGGLNKISSGIVNFLFGASPTQVAPSASSAAGAGSNITINQNFGGMGVIDHNFAANNIIPAINKAINTGQARIG